MWTRANTCAVNNVCSISPEIGAAVMAALHGPLRLLLLAFYAFAAFAKVNYDFFATPVSRGTVAMFSMTVRCGRRPEFCTTYPMRRRSCTGSMPETFSP